MSVVGGMLPDMIDDPRIQPPRVGTEREVLAAYLDWHRKTFELKCTGVAREKLSEKGIPPSGLSLHGLLRHLAGVERWWFRQQFMSEDIPHLYYTEEDPNQDFDSLDGDPAADFAVWQAECARSREIVARSSLEQTGIRRSTGEPISLRWIMLHLIAEYARHIGHADLLRERIDGMTGL
jgi:hypothetical protein